MDKHPLKNNTFHLPTVDEIADNRGDLEFVKLLSNNLKQILKVIESDPDSYNLSLYYHYITETLYKGSVLLRKHQNNHVYKGEEVVDPDELITQSLYVCRRAANYSYDVFLAHIDIDPLDYWAFINIHMLYADVLGYLNRRYEAIDVLRIARRYFFTYNGMNAHPPEDINSIEERLMLEEYRVSTGILAKGAGPDISLTRHLIDWGRLLEKEFKKDSQTYNIVKELTENLSKIAGNNPPSLYEEDFEQPSNKEDYYYRKYCWEYNLFLSPFNSLYPYYELIGKHPYDMMEELIYLEYYSTDKSRIIMTDVLLSYCHSRYLWYVDAKIGTNKIFPAERIMEQDTLGFRDISVEPLIDCFSRCYSILDKIAKVVQIEFGIEIVNDNGKKVDAYFSGIIYKISNDEKYSKNPFLRNLVDLYHDINPRSSRGKYDYKMWPGLENIVDIRNHIMHSGLAIVGPNKVGKSDRDVAYMTTSAFIIQTERLLYIVKNAIMYLNSAVIKNNIKTI